MKAVRAYSMCLFAMLTVSAAACGEGQFDPTASVADVSPSPIVVTTTPEDTPRPNPGAGLSCDHGPLAFVLTPHEDENLLTIDVRPAHAGAVRYTYRLDRLNADTNDHRPHAVKETSSPSVSFGVDDGDYRVYGVATLHESCEPPLKSKETMRTVQFGPRGGGGGGGSPTPPIPPVPGPKPPQLVVGPLCTGADTVILPGTPVAFSIGVPLGAYTIVTVTGDKFHEPGYQLGQIETARVRTDGVDRGITLDVPDLAKTQESRFDVTAAIGTIMLVGEEGSLHGQQCVSVWTR